MAYGELEPFGTWTDDFRAARLSALISNLFQAVWGGNKGSTDWTQVEEFLPVYLQQEFGKPVQEQSVEEMKAILLQLAGKSPKKDQEED